MYLEYYGLTEAPFSITPNPRFLFFSAKHREAFNHLLYGIRERRGFVQLTGEVGAGKTTLCRALLEQLGQNFSTALILNPVLDADHLIKAIAMEFGLNVTGLDRLEILAAINHFLLQQMQQGRETVLIIDEAQNLTNELLEQVRLLSNLETDDRKLLQIVLMGQPELRDRLNDHRLRQLRQRITVRYHLRPLKRGEIGRYVQHRLQVSGSKGGPFFTYPALWAIYRYSQGIPRLVNAVCDKCLLAGYVHQRETINYRMVRVAVRELEGEHMSLINDALKQAGKAREVPEFRTIPTLSLQPVEDRERRQNVMIYVLPVLLLVILCLAAWFLWQWWRVHEAAAVQVPKVVRKTAPAVVAPAAVSAEKRPSRINQFVENIFSSPQPAPAVQPIPEVTPAAPTAPPIKMARPFPVMKLQGVFYRAANASALLNGQIVYLGTVVDGVEVVGIEKQSVTVRFEGQAKVLHLRN